MKFISFKSNEVEMTHQVECLFWFVGLGLTSVMNHSRSHLQVVQVRPFKGDQRIVVWSTSEVSDAIYTQINKLHRGDKHPRGQFNCPKQGWGKRSLRLTFQKITWHLELRGNQLDWRVCSKGELFTYTSMPITLTFFLQKSSIIFFQVKLAWSKFCSVFIPIF